jgi:hypothetical protein
MNAYDRLLTWASELGQGDWGRWRDVCRYLGLEPTVAACALSDLGHVEFDWVGNRFAVAAPAAILLPRSSGSALLTGARPTGLRRQMEERAENLRHDVYLHPPIDQDHGPATWLCEGALEDLPSFCAELGMQFQVQSGRHLLTSLPPATFESAAIRERPIDRLPRSWFDSRVRRFKRIEEQARDGLWSVEEPRRKAHYVHRAGTWYRVPVREYGAYLAHPQETFLHYSTSDTSLLVDAEAPLPPLLARALTLQSGRIPRRGRRVHYLNVDRPLADTIAVSLAAKYEILP